ncbi:MAG: hypothetical protein MJE66_19520 [Proteobacteria bacterium]|nr:hypothetical protein [Pseudomonadota bacterium]
MAYDDDDLDLQDGGGLPDFARDPLGIPMRRWPWMLLGLLVGLGGTAAAVLLYQPTYQARASILVSNAKIPDEMIRSTVQEDPLEQLNAMVGEVLSRDRLFEILEEFQLYPEERDKRPARELVMWLRGSIGFEVVDQIGSDPRRRRRDGSTSKVFVVTFTYGEPETAARVVNRLTGFFTDASVRARNEQAQRIARFVNQELERAEAALREQTQLITEFQERYRGELPSELPTLMSKLERLQAQRQSLSDQIVEAESRMAMIAASDQEPGSVESRLAQLRTELDRTAAIYTDEHPQVLSLKRRIAVVEAELAASADNPATSSTRTLLLREVRFSLERLHQQLTDTETELAELDARVARVPRRQEELATLEEKASVLRESYLEFLRKSKDAELAVSIESAQEGAQVSVMDSARPPTRPMNSRWKLLAMGLVAAAGLCGGLGVLFELLDPVLVAGDQLETKSGAPVLGSVSRIA